MSTHTKNCSTQELLEIQKYLIGFHERHFEKVVGSFIDEQSSMIFVVFKDTIFNRFLMVAFRAISKNEFKMTERIVDVSVLFKDKK